MQKFISTKALYSSIKSVSDEVQNGTTFVVLKYSRPVYQISPIPNNVIHQSKKKYKLSDLKKFAFKTGDKYLSQNIDKILYE